MMLGTSQRIFLVGMLMVIASASAEYLKPSNKMAEGMPTINLEQMIPSQAGVWAVDQVQLKQIVDSNTDALLNKIYGQTLSRSYMDSQGHRIMLSIAYGGDQSKELQVHRPEVCYTAQGFQVMKNAQDALDTAFGTLPVKRLVTVRGERIEPITYWIMVGNEAAVGIKVKLAQIRYGLTGTVPDGMLVRISSIDADEKAAYAMQDQFIREMLSAMNAQDRARLIGHFGS